MMEFTGGLALRAVRAISQLWRRAVPKGGAGAITGL
jgi:hypothetical protein